MGRDGYPTSYPRSRPPEGSSGYRMPESSRTVAVAYPLAGTTTATEAARGYGLPSGFSTCRTYRPAAREIRYVPSAPLSTVASALPVPSWVMVIRPEYGRSGQPRSVMTGHPPSTVIFPETPVPAAGGFVVAGMLAAGPAGAVLPGAVLPGAVLTVPPDGSAGLDGCVVVLTAQPAGI